MNLTTTDALCNVRIHPKPLTNHQLMFEAFGLCDNINRNASGEYTCMNTQSAFRIFMHFSVAADWELAASRIEINTKAQLVKKLEKDVEYWKAKALKRVAHDQLTSV